MLLRIPAVFLAALAVPLSLASEPDALAISQNIQARHLPYGVILDPVFATPDSDQIVSYSRCGDSAIWTGNYLAAEAFRYKVTHSADALANATRAVAGIKSLLDVTGNNVLARCLVPVDSPYAGAIQGEEGPNGIYRSGPENFWIGNTSRDQYSGVMFGLGVAFDMVDDPALKSSIAAQITRMVDFLRSKDWSVVMPNGSITTTFLIRPDQQLAFLQLARHVNPDRFSTTYDINRLLLSPTVLAPVSIEVLDDNSYFKFNIDTINFYTLIHLENSSFNVIYHKAYDVLRNHTDNHANAFFNMIDRALNGPNPTRDAETRALLDQWLQRPRRDVYVDLRGKYPACGDIACSPIPVPLRVTTDFIWQRSPFQLVGGGAGDIETAGIDYILPYWMARYYGVLDADRVVDTGIRAVSAASGALTLAPEELASLIGSNFTPQTEFTSAEPPPMTLAGVSLLVRDSAGDVRSAPISFASPDRINFVVPAGTAPGSATIVIQLAGAADQLASAEIRAVAPALFTANGTGTGAALATAVRVTVAGSGPLDVYRCDSNDCFTVPIDLGVDTPISVILYGTGIRNRSSLDNVTCTIGGVSVPVLDAGAQPGSSSVDQVKVALTLSLRGIGETDAVVTVDGQPSNPVRINIR